MLKTILPTLLAIPVLAACSAASGPSFNASATDFADGSRAYRVECHGLFESVQTCIRVAKRICDGQDVQELARRQSSGTMSDKLDDPRVQTFRCAAPPVPVVAPAEEVHPPIVLSADALFAFDRSDADAIGPEGRARLDEVAATLRGAANVQHMHIVVAGYTDRLGEDAYNVDLSQRRADTVKQYLQCHGVTAAIDAHGYGKAMPGADCAASGQVELIQCLASDRRVEIRIKR